MLLIADTLQAWRGDRTVVTLFLVTLYLVTLFLVKLFLVKFFLVTLFLVTRFLLFRDSHRGLLYFRALFLSATNPFFLFTPAFWRLSGSTRWSPY